MTVVILIHPYMIYWKKKEEKLSSTTDSVAFTYKMCIDKCCIIFVLCCDDQDGIISPETDSGFVGSESSRVTPAAAASPVHQRASERWGSQHCFCASTQIYCTINLTSCAVPHTQHTDVRSCNSKAPNFLFYYCFSVSLNHFLSVHIFCVFCLCMFEYSSMVRQCFSASGWESREASDRPSLSTISYFLTVTLAHGCGAQRGPPAPPWPAVAKQTGAEETHLLLLSTAMGQSDGPNQGWQWDQWTWAGEWQQWVLKFCPSAEIIFFKTCSSHLKHLVAAKK